MRNNFKIPRNALGFTAMGGILLLALWWLFPKSLLTSPSGNPALDRLRIQLESSKFNKLQGYREAALARGMLTEAEKDWKKAKLVLQDTTVDIKLRLKGDWTDHLESNKWSFRIKVKNGLAWKGMREFSLQNPSTRSYLKEWLFHQALIDEQVLCTRYGFAHLELNGDDWGMYAVEEHFAKALVESQGRRDGPILKVDESGLWEARARYPKEDVPWELVKPIYESAATLPFEEKRWLGDSAGSQVLNHALRLMQQYREASVAPSQVFNLDVMARRYALTDLFGAHHSLIWHNRRYYYNPINSRLEPVVFDGFAGPGAAALLNGPFTGYGCNGATRYGGQADLLGTFFFKDEDFLRSYYGLLALYSQPNYIDHLLARHELDLKALEMQLQSEQWSYSFDPQFLFDNAQTIRNALQQPLASDQLPGSLESTGVLDCYCLENRSGLAIELKTALGEPVVLEAFDRVEAAFSHMLCLPSGQLPEYRVLGQPKWLAWPLNK